MAKPASIQFTGTENLEQIFTGLPVQYRKPVLQKIFAKAASKFVTAAKREFNGSTKKALGTVQGKSAEYPATYAGLVRKGGNSWEYQRAYWRNFGTLSRRDPNHAFTKPRRRSSANWKGGIEATQAVGRAWEANQGEAARVIEQEAAAIANKFLQSKAKRK